ncbi:MAG TPA: glycoside hydrolase family 2 TIM barrel-domain containing protein [Panacibacter sp.]|nr:glycoside hydrolase family 2 TIM barrel-domain containing protein [Panacibacter sp.]HNP45171.1 glycoside hydrolase family 2 TIM barrel-domain containing protein [Panacibacter sp.]
MRKIACCILVFFFFSKKVIAQTAERSILSLDGRWHYIVDPYNTGDRARFYLDKQQNSKTQLLEYDFEKSPTLSVPGDWNSQDDKLLFYEGPVWYEKKFEAAPKEGKKYFVQFEAVNYKADVYVNGAPVGSHTGGFTPFEFEVTGFLVNGSNSIVVKADNTRKKENVPTEDFDWWNYGGITRNVMLEERPATFISDFNIQLSKGDLNSATGSIQLTGNRLQQEITIQILEANLQVKIKTDSSGKASFIFPVKNITYWTPENPQLYTVTASADSDAIRDRIGFRTIQTEGQNMLLNGKSIFLRGVCLHEENPSIPGRPRNIDEYRLLLLKAKEMHCNFVRLAHYPHSAYVSKLADEMGLLLWEEVPVYWSINWENQSAFENAKQQLTELIRRDHNRASVIIWSVGNETSTNDAREKFMEGLADLARHRDSTRLISAALLGHFDSAKVFHLNDPLSNKLDVVSFNEYAGWYFSSPDSISTYTFNITTSKPVIVTEFGGDALAGFHTDSATRFSEEFQEKIYKEQLGIISNIDGLRGIAPWILFDFRSPKRINPTYQQYWNRKGLISETGQKKKAYYVLKGFYEIIEKKYKSN